jgi:polyhydroxybutyrate depolymerase
MLSAVRLRSILVLLTVVTVLGPAFAPSSAARPATKGRSPHGSPGCGKAATTGVVTEHAVVDGTDREYLLSVPDRYDRSKPAPLLFDFHGLGSDMEEQSLYSHLDEQGGARGYVVITPNGQGDLLRHWSLQRSKASNPDVAFVQEMLRTTNRSLCIDQRRVFATGMSNGAMFSTVLACALPGRFAAIAPVSGVNATHACDAGTPPVSVLAFHGTADPIVPYEGGAYFSGAAAGRATTGAQAMPVDRATAAWAEFDGCRTPPATRWVADDVQRVAWPGCPADGTVALYRVIGGGHTWPGSTPVRADRLGATTSSISATTLMLDFFGADPPA